MSAAFGTWIGNGTSGTWTPAINPALVDDPRFPTLLEAAKDGVSFADAVVLVTGASDPASIGYAIAKNFAQGGAKVIITGSRDLPKITATAEKLAAEAGAGSVLPAQVNQGDLTQIDALLAHLKEQNLALTHVFPFAAINHPQIFVGIKPEDYARVFSVNVFGVYHLCAQHARRAPRNAPWYVVIPLSPNDGRLQGLGLYPSIK
jgi:NAD(P)-dependent dehydrogenase (short-subunit alcohol dehydrogenase family)